MADLLTHVLVGYILATSCSIRYDWITPPMVTVTMIGAMIPDIYRVSILVHDGTVVQLIGVPFSWQGIHTIGGSLGIALLGAALTHRAHRTRVFLLLALGVATHMLLDALLYSLTGEIQLVFWPLSPVVLSTPGFYLSTDRWPALVSAITAAVVWSIRYRSSIGSTHD